MESGDGLVHTKRRNERTAVVAGDGATADSNENGDQRKGKASTEGITEASFPRGAS